MLNICPAAIDLIKTPLHSTPPLNPATTHKRSRRSDGERSENTAQTILPPFSGTLAVDKALQWRRRNFKQSMETLIKNDPSVVNKLEATPPYPTCNYPHLLGR